jgi:hypothetical protein
MLSNCRRPDHSGADGTWGRHVNCRAMPETVPFAKGSAPVPDAPINANPIPNAEPVIRVPFRPAIPFERRMSFERRGTAIAACDRTRAEGRKPDAAILPWFPSAAPQERDVLRTAGFGATHVKSLIRPGCGSGSLAVAA